jgi:hypothetical protein
MAALGIMSMAAENSLAQQHAPAKYGNRKWRMQRGGMALALARKRIKQRMAHQAAVSSGQRKMALAKAASWRIRKRHKPVSAHQRKTGGISA